MKEYVECKHILINQFMDEVYLTESILKKKDWINMVAKNQNYLFRPKQIMKRLKWARDNNDLEKVTSINKSEYESLPSESQFPD